MPDRAVGDGFRHHRGLGIERVSACGEEPHGHAANALASVGLAVLVEVGKDQVADSADRIEAKVKGEIAVRVDQRVQIRGGTQLRVEVRWLSAGGKREVHAANASDGRINRIVTVFIGIIVDSHITALARHRHLARQLAGALEIRSRDHQVIIARIQIVKGVKTAVAREGAGQQQIVRRAMQFHEHAIHAFTIVIDSVAIQVIEDQVANCHLGVVHRLEAKVDGHVPVRVLAVAIVIVSLEAVLTHGGSHRRVHWQRTRLHQELRAADAPVLRRRIVQAVFAHAVIRACRRSAEQGNLAGQRAVLAYEVRGANIDEVGAAREIAEEVVAAIRRGHGRRWQTAHRRATDIDVQHHTVHAFAWIVVAVVVGVDEHQVANDGRALEAEVHRQIHSGINVIVSGVIRAGLAIVVGWGETGLQINPVGPHAFGHRIGVIKAVLAHIVVTKLSRRDADLGFQRRAGKEHLLGNVDPVEPWLQVREQVASACVRHGAFDKGQLLVLPDGHDAINLDRHVGHALAIVRHAVAIAIDKDQVAHAHTAVEAEVQRQIHPGISRLRAVVRLMVEARLPLRVCRQRIHDQRYRSAGDPGGLRCSGIHAIFTGVIISLLDIRKAEQPAKQSRRTELSGRNVHHIDTWRDVGEHILAAVGRHQEIKRLVHSRHLV